MHRALTIFPKIYMCMIALVFTGVMLSQLRLDYSFNDAIITTNYFALVIGSAIFAFLALFCYCKKFNIGKSDIAVVALAIFVSIHSRDGLQTKEVAMSLAYIALYFSLRLVGSLFVDFNKYATTAILLIGIDQSITVLLQVCGFKMSRNLNFLVSGDFFNPGPCGIFLSGVLVLALTIVRRSDKCKRILLIDYAQYYISYAALILSFLAIVPTLSRAGWLGAVAGGGVLYYEDLRHHFKLLCDKYALNTKLVTIAVVLVCILACVSVYLMKKESANGRVFMWKNTVSAAMTSPVLGVGVGNFAKYYAAEQSDYFMSKNTLDVYDSNIDITKLYDIKRDKKMMKYYGEILLNKEPKIASSAVNNMKQDVQILLNEL